MNGFTIHVALEPLQGASPTPLAELQPQLWNMLCDYAARFTSGAMTVWEDYMPWALDQPEAFRTDGYELLYTLPTDGGERAPSAGVAEHWLRASHAAAFHAVSSFVQDHGWIPAGGTPDLAEIVWGEHEVGWLQQRDEIWQFRFDDPTTLHGAHGRQLQARDIGPDLATVLDAAIERGLCPCHMCEMLRPDPAFEATMLTSLEDDNMGVVQSAIWYLRQTARVRTSTALAVTRHGVGEPREHAAACHDFGTKLTADDLDTVLDELQRAEDDATRCGLLGLAAGMSIDATSAGSQRRLFTFVSALSEGSPVREVAAEYAGYGRVAEGHEDHFARGLVKQIGASDEFDHNVALTLFNFYMGAPAVPSFALDAVARLAAHDSEQVQAIAAFAHAHLLSKPRR